jgi:hypothetical protein
MWEDVSTGHDRIATTHSSGDIEVWDGETFTVLRTLTCQAPTARVFLLPFKSAEGRTRLLVTSRDLRVVEVWDPEENVVLPELIRSEGAEPSGFHLFESAEGRQLLAFGPRLRRGEADKAFLDVWDLGEAFMEAQHVRPANKHG